MWVHLNILQSKTSAKVGNRRTKCYDTNYMMHNQIAKLLARIVCLVGTFTLIFSQLGHSIHRYRNNDTSSGKGLELWGGKEGEKNPNIPNYGIQVTVTGLAWQSLKFIMIFILTHCLFSFFTLPAPTSASYNNKWGKAEVHHEVSIVEIIDPDLQGSSKSRSSTTLSSVPLQHSGLMSWNEKETNCWR